MNKVVIIVDSTCDLPKDIVEKNGLVIVPLTVNFPDQTYYDGVDITTDKLYKLVAEKNVLPKTAAVTLGEIYNVFEKYINLGYSYSSASIKAIYDITNDTELTNSFSLPNNTLGIGYLKDVVKIKELSFILS